MLSKFKRTKHQQHLSQLPKIRHHAADTETLFSAQDFRSTLLARIRHAQQRICLVALYLEQDEGGRDILEALYQAKLARPELDITILVDWHRAQRGRIGDHTQSTNADWYCEMAEKYPTCVIPVYGVPVNTREALGVLHLKGFIIDDTLLYSGASLNDVYLHRNDKYRYDRYHLLRNSALTDTLLAFIRQQLLTASAVQRLDRQDRPKSLEIKNEIRQFRQQLRAAGYQFTHTAREDELSLTPLVGLGKKNLLNKTIHHLIAGTEHNLVICTPYFNLPAVLVRDIIYLLRNGVKVEIIVGDKTANDFYIPESEPFRIIGALPYLYEINLRRFMSRLQRFVDADLLHIRLWKDQDNSYHLKGIWSDEQWHLITGNNLNPRAWRLDLENAILIHDPNQVLAEQKAHELACIHTHTQLLRSYEELENIAQYPLKVKKLIRRLRRIRIDRLISRIL